MPRTSFRKIVKASPTYGTESSGTNSLTCSTSTAVHRGLCMTGPLPFTMSKGMFIPDRGVRMSENKMTYHDQCERNQRNDNNQLTQKEKYNMKLPK
jgi:hypothetical protein